MLNTHYNLKKVKTRIKDNKIKQLFFKEVERTKEDAKTRLTKEQLLTITILSLISAFLTVWTKIMVFMRWSTFESNAVFWSWHPFTPILAMIASSLYIYCLWEKGVRYWLAYFPAFFSIFYYIIEYSMIHCLLHPSALKALFGPFADNLPNWLTGL